MALFVAIAKSTIGDSALEQALTEIYPGDHLKLSTTCWLVADDGTAKEVSDKLGVTEGKIPSAIIMSVSNYWGRASTETWEWMRTRMSAPRSRG